MVEALTLTSQHHGSQRQSLCWFVVRILGLYTLRHDDNEMFTV